MMKQNESIREAISILQEQAETLGLCLSRYRSLQALLREKQAWHGVAEATKEIEPLLARLAALVKRQQGFLADKGTARMTRFVVQQGAGSLRDTALRLIKCVAELETALRRESADAQMLLENSHHFAVFNINVMTAVKANETYVPPGAAETEHARGVKMFDANV